LAAPAIDLANTFSAAGAALAAEATPIVGVRIVVNPPDTATPWNPNEAREG
jgi:hypothetical protein